MNSFLNTPYRTCSTIENETIKVRSQSISQIFDTVILTQFLKVLFGMFLFYIQIDVIDLLYQFVKNIKTVLTTVYIPKNLPQRC